MNLLKKTKNSKEEKAQYYSIKKHDRRSKRVLLKICEELENHYILIIDLIYDKLFKKIKKISH